jgi:N12 class adenine-specific DNA methylase
MEQKRLGLISKAMLVVPGHCLAQVSREFLQLYPTARILVADETNFVKAKRSRFLARAATANWDAVIITHAAFRFIPVPAGFERAMIQEQITSCAELVLRSDDDDRVTRKRLEAMKEKLGERLEALKEPARQHGDAGRDRHRPDHRRRGARVPQAQGQRCAQQRRSDD